MNDERLMRDLAVLVAEHDRDVARLQDACMHATPGASTSEAELLRPLGADFRAATVERLAQELDLRGPVAAAGGSRTIREAPSFGASLAGWLAAPLRALTEHAALSLGAVAATVLIAAALFGVFREPAVDSQRFPTYQLSLQGKARFRGADPAASGPVVLGVGDAFHLLLRPERSIEGPVAFAAFVVSDGAVQPLSAPPAQMLDNGVVRIEGAVGADVRLPLGDARLLVVVTRPQSLPDGAELLRRMQGRETLQAGDWGDAWSLDIRVQP